MPVRSANAPPSYSPRRWPPSTIERRHGAAAVTLVAGDLAATFLPELGMVGVRPAVAGRAAGRAARAAPGPWRPATPAASRSCTRGPTAWPAAATWPPAWPSTCAGSTCPPTTTASRCTARWSAGAGWEVTHATTDGDGAVLATRFDYGARPDLLAAFPFPHVVELTVGRRPPTALRLTTTVTATTDQPVPVSFGWHPYLRVPGPRAGLAAAAAGARAPRAVASARSRRGPRRPQPAEDEADRRPHPRRRLRPRRRSPLRPHRRRVPASTSASTAATPSPRCGCPRGGASPASSR